MFSQLVPNIKFLFKESRSSWRHCFLINWLGEWWRSPVALTQTCRETCFVFLSSEGKSPEQWRKDSQGVWSKILLVAFKFICIYKYFTPSFYTGLLSKPDSGEICKVQIPANCVKLDGRKKTLVGFPQCNKRRGRNKTWWGWRSWPATDAPLRLSASAASDVLTRHNLRCRGVFAAMPN